LRNRRNQMAQKPRAKQSEIPGTERAVHKDIRAKAEALFEARSERMELTKQESKLSGELMALMKKHGLTEHIEGDMKISIVAVDEKVKVKRLADEDA